MPKEEKPQVIDLTGTIKPHPKLAAPFWQERLADRSGLAVTIEHFEKRTLQLLRDKVRDVTSGRETGQTTDIGFGVWDDGEEKWLAGGRTEPIPDWDKASSMFHDIITPPRPPQPKGPLD